jgi:hypothetical protein
MIKLIWQMDRHNDWSRDYIEYIFRKVPHQTVEDFDQKLEEDRSIIVYNSTVNNLDYLKRLHSQGKRVVLIHLADEWLVDSTEPYQYADLVLRHYYKDCGPKVINFSTGWMKDCPTNIPDKTVFEREYIWSFFGHIDGKPTRRQMADAMLNVPMGVYYYIPNHISFALTSIEMTEYYSKSIFVPCSRGNMSFDTLRANEALQVGALPIVESSDYWSKLYGPDHPLLMVENWNQAPALIDSLMKDTTALEKRRFDTLVWWQNYKQDLINFVSREITKFSQ